MKDAEKVYAICHANITLLPYFIKLEDLNCRAWALGYIFKGKHEENHCDYRLHREEFTGKLCPAHLP